MRPVVPVVLALLLASCSSGTAKPAASGSPTPSVTRAPTSTGRSLVLAVTRAGDPAVWLYRVGVDRRAFLVSTLRPPGRFFTTYGITLSAGARPDLCVIWSGDEPEGDGSGEEATYCHPGAGDEGFRVPVEGQVDEIALDAEGRRLFWSTLDESDDTTTGVVAAYRSGRVSDRRSLEVDCSRYLLSAVWAGTSRLVLHCTSGDNDDPGSLWTQELGSGSGSPREGRKVGEDEQFAQPGSADETSVLALERHCDAACDTVMPRMRSPRAVRVDLLTGGVLEVIATPAKGRFVSTVTGGAHGIVYVTDAEGEERDVRVHLRWPGEKHGTPITGLPDDVEKVVAQP